MPTMTYRGGPVIRDGNGFGDGEVLLADVCIIGGGPAGLAVASELLGSRLRVVLLEAGSGSPPEGGEKYEPSRVVGLPYVLEESRARGLGGTSHMWGIPTPAPGPHVRLRELDELDFESRPGVRTPGWPFSRSVLEPYYRRARDLLRLPQGEPEIPWRGSDLTHRTFSFAPAMIFTQELPARVTAHPHTEVVVNAVVVHLDADGPGQPVTSATVRGSTGRTAEVRARVYVLACGGIENARMLLASRSSSMPTGLGNGSGQVGRHFMEHPHFNSGAIVPVDDRLVRHPEDWAIVLRDGRPVQRKYGLSEAARRRHGVLDVSYYMEPRPARWAFPQTADGRADARGLSAFRNLRMAARTHERRPSLAADVATSTWAAPKMAAYVVRQAMAQRAVRRGRRPRHPLVFTLDGMAEQEPSADSAVRLGRGVDRFGVPVIELDWRITSADWESMRRSHALVTPLLSEALGARVVALMGDEPSHLGWGWHHMGTTRMAARPEDGVVDADCRLHGVDNVFIAGSSVFPTGGSANPTLTLIALAMRLADRLTVELRSA